MSPTDAASSDGALCVPVADATLARAIRIAGLAASSEADLGRLLARIGDDDGAPAVVIVDATATAITDAMAVCRSLRRLDPPFAPIVLVVGAAHLAELPSRAELFDDFVTAPVLAEELGARLVRILGARTAGRGGEVVVHGPLVINLETYQASIDGRALDLTYMEYELLRFLASNPTRALTRETLLNRVWGYEYYGGARTVDVHVRRLRAKLGEEHAHLVQTVRSVGYRFG